MSWRCLPTSPNEYFSNVHKEWDLFRQNETLGPNGDLRPAKHLSMINRLIDLHGSGLSCSTIKETLNAEGYRTANGRLFTMCSLYATIHLLKLNKRRKVHE